MISKSLISKLVEEKITGTEYFVVDISVDSNNRIRVEIDGKHGVKISDCVQISRHIEGSFDREEEDFELTVSSAGMDQPFKILRQYERYMGREVQTITSEGQKIKGKLVAADKDELVLETTSKEKVEGQKKKQLISKTIKVPMEQVKETKVVISFK
tara:strand:- start:85 stop:552 length:468 start_codon:yes stop_codon:yes gene_type:complete